MGLALAMTLVLAGCLDPPEPPPVPDMLVAHEEIPFGDLVLGQTTRAMIAALDRLEPEWGRLDTEILSLADADATALEAEVAGQLGPEWQALDLADFPAERGRLFGYSDDEHLVAYLVVEPDEGELRPVVMFLSDDW